MTQRRTTDDAAAEKAGPEPARAEPAQLAQSEERFRLLVESVPDYAIFMLDPQGYIASWNLGAERIKGYRPQEVIGKHFSIFYPPEALARRLPEHELETALRVGRYEDEGWRLRKDGGTFWANVVISPLRDRSGQHLGFAKVTRDLTERRRHEEILRESEERFRLLVEGVRDYAIFMLDPGGHITSWNEGAARIKGYRPQEIIGKHFSIFYPKEALQRRLPEHELKVAIREGRYEEEGWRLRKDGTPFWANVVITALHDRAGQLRGFAKVTRDLTERRRVEILEHEGRQTTEFLAMLGHELRNPLAPIRNAVEIIRTSEVKEPSVLWARDLIDRQVSHLSRLVDDLLDMSRIASGKVTLQKEPLDLNLVVARAVESIGPLLKERQHELSLTLPTEPLHVEGDATRLSQVVLNLIGNAIKYTPNGGELAVLLAREDGHAVLRVRDNGMGMPTELVPRAFDLFVQGERSLDRSEGGLGIGLTLVRELVASHGGRVTASSAGPGRGSEFVVWLPVLVGAPRETPPPVEASIHPIAPKARRILVVDDSEESAESMSALLQMWGHDVRVAHDGPGALALAADHRPEVVLLDIGLPGMTGYEVAQRLRDDSETSGVVLVALTGYSQEEHRQRSREAGFALHLVKPVVPEVLRRFFADLERDRDEVAP